jgi:hypothetical protein
MTKSFTAAAQPRTCTDVSLRCYGSLVPSYLNSYQGVVRGEAGRGSNAEDTSASARFGWRSVFANKAASWCVVNFDF